MAGIFEAFALLFTADTEKAQEGVKKLDDGVENLDGKVDDAQKKIKKLSQESVSAGESLGSFGERLKEIAAATIGYFAFERMLERFGEARAAAAALHNFSGAIDENIEEVSAWADATKMAGGSTDGFKQSLASLARAQADVAATGKSRLTPFFNELGIKLTDSNGKAKKALDLLPDIQRAFSKIGKERAFAFGQKIGLDDGTIMLLQKSRKELDELIDRQRWLGVITKEQGDAADDWGSSLDDTDHAWRSLTAQLIVAFLPAVKAVNSAIQNVLVFFKDHSNFIEGATYALSAFAVMAGIAMVAAAPISAIIAAITIGVTLWAAAMATAYDDFKTWMEGGDSLIGRLLGDFPTFKAKALDAFNSVTDAIKEAVEAVKKLWHAITHPGEALDEIAGGIKSLFGPLMQGLPDINGMMHMGISALGAASTPLAALGSAAIGGGSIVNGGSVTINKMEINSPSADPAEVARKTIGELDRQVNHVYAATDNGTSH